jgi:type IX secretion system PorP/SprF family membrane protein
MKKNYLLQCMSIVLLVFICNTGKAQDPHFSQYFSSPVSINPALTGKGVDDWRAIGTYRAQWWGGTIAPFTTTAVSLEKSFHSTAGKSNWGLGLSMLSDASNSGLLKNNYINASIAYNIGLSGDGRTQLGIGMTGSFANRILDASKFTFQTQFGSMGFQRSVSSGDPVNVLSANYFDMNIGAHLSSVQNKGGYSLGFAAFHVSSPTQGVYNGSTYKVPMRYNIQGSVFTRMASSDELHFSTLTDIQGNNTIFTLGALYKMHTKDETIESINIGIWNRFGDSFYPYAGIESKTWLFGISYDVVNSEVRDAYNAVQSIELSFALRFGKKRVERANGGFIY